MHTRAVAVNFGGGERKEKRPLVMAALCNRAGHHIFALWFLSSSFFFLFPRLISAIRANWMSAIHGVEVW